MLEIDKNRFVKISNLSKSGYQVSLSPIGMSEKDCRKEGYKKYHDCVLPEKTGYFMDLSGFIENDTDISAIYVYKQIPPVVKRYQKAIVIQKLMEMDLWSPIKKVIVDLDYYDLFQAKDILNQNNQFFQKALKEIFKRNIISETKLAEILESSRI